MEDKETPTWEQKASAKRKPQYEELSTNKRLDTKEQKAVVGGGGNIPTDSSAITRRPSTPASTPASTPVVPSTRGRGGGRYGGYRRSYR